MSHAIVCDQCDTMLRTNARGDDEMGESEAWVGLDVVGEHFQLCTISCAVTFLQRDEIAAAVGDHLAAIAYVVRAIRGDDAPR